MSFKVFCHLQLKAASLEGLPTFGLTTPLRIFLVTGCVLFGGVCNIMEGNEDEELVSAYLLAVEEETKAKPYKKKTYNVWIHDIFKKKSQHEEYLTLVPDLLHNDVKFFRCFCMSQARFTALVDIMKPYLLRQTTTYQEAKRLVESLAESNLRGDSLVASGDIVPSMNLVGGISLNPDNREDIIDGARDRM
ncbi:hypothetical protein FQR65_LT06274 [Abscondita terminalis]|nr:hypothetical protein FQR65_LT06274 [Abscondita terminalis]